MDNKTTFEVYVVDVNDYNNMRNRILAVYDKDDTFGHILNDLKYNNYKIHDIELAEFTTHIRVLIIVEEII